MNLNKLRELLKHREKIPDEDLKRHFDGAIRRLLGQDPYHNMRLFAYYGFVGSLLLIFLATGVITLLGAVGLVKLEPVAFNALWKLLIAEMVPLSIWLVKVVWRQKK